jgi:hypothetical protein
MKINISMQYRYWDTLDENRLQVSSKADDHYRSMDSEGWSALSDFE